MRAIVAIALLGVAVGMAAAIPVDHPLSPFAVVHAQAPTGQKETPAKPPCEQEARNEADTWLLYGMVAVAFIIVLGGSSFFWKDPQEQTTARVFFYLGLIYTAVLLTSAAFYESKVPWNCKPYLLNGILPIAVPWFGALGAVTISLEGVFMWNQQWEPRFNYWHIGRPLFGAVLGTVAFFIFVVIVSAAGPGPSFLGNTAATPPSGTMKEYITFYVVAFLVGYREETFRDLIKRATDLILKPGTTTPPAPNVAFKINGVVQTQIAFGVGGPLTEILQVENIGTTALLAPITVTLTPAANTPANVFATANDHVSGGVDLAPQQMRTVDITFTPPAGAPGPFNATLSVTGKNLTTPKTIAVRG